MVRNTLGQYRESNSLTNDQLASELSALLGKKIGPESVKLWTGRKRPPKAWASALGIEWELPEPELDDFAPEDVQLGVEDELGEIRMPPPSAPAGGRRTAPAPSQTGDFAFVKDRLVKFYGAVGAGVSMVTQNDGYGKVANDYAPDLADAWINAAKANANVAKIVEFMESGGPVGELVVAHVILVLGFVYVSGRGPDLDFLYAGRYAGYRHAARAADAGAEVDASGQNGAAHPVADAATAPA